MRIIVYHAGYGCDTGCCGHTIEIAEGDVPKGKTKYNFIFDHPATTDIEDKKKFAKDLVTQEYGVDHVKDLDWENCLIFDLGEWDKDNHRGCWQ